MDRNEREGSEWGVKFDQPQEEDLGLWYPPAHYAAGWIAVYCYSVLTTGMGQSEVTSGCRSSAMMARRV